MKLFSSEADLSKCNAQLNSAHIFWQAGSGRGDTGFLVRAIEQNRIGWRIVQDLVCRNELIHVGVCAGAMMAGSRYFGRNPAAMERYMYQFFVVKVSLVYDNALPRWEDDAVLHIIGGVAIAIECANTHAASAFIVGKTNWMAWLEKCDRINEKLQRTVHFLEDRWEVYAWYKPNGEWGHWWWKVDGTEWYWGAEDLWGFAP